MSHTDGAEWRPSEKMLQINRAGQLGSWLRPLPGPSVTYPPRPPVPLSLFPADTAPLPLA